MSNATERIYRTPDGHLVTEANVKDGASGGLGTGLAYAEGDEMTDEDAKAYKSGSAVKEAPASGVVGLSPATPKVVNPSKPSGTIEVSNPAVKK